MINLTTSLLLLGFLLSDRPAILNDFVSPDSVHIREVLMYRLAKRLIHSSIEPLFKNDRISFNELTNRNVCCIAIGFNN